MCEHVSRRASSLFSLDINSRLLAAAAAAAAAIGQHHATVCSTTTRDDFNLLLSVVANLDQTVIP